jgi:protocatechuate 3,4-dioxygenase beta subunit
MIIENEAALTQAVCADMAATPNQRLRHIMDALVRHLHAFLREARLTEEEWELGIAFLTAMGQATNASHNETILAADVLGASSLVGMLNNPAFAGESESALLGPFWRKSSPELALGSSIARPGTPGMPMRVSGRITDRDGGPLAGALVDVWQADPRGLYDNQIEGLDCMNLRGQFRTDDDGRFYFLSVHPAGYPVPTHGPTGDLLRAQCRSAYRPAHVHFMVSAPGYRTLITQVFADDAEHLESDVTFSVMRSLVATFERHESLEGAPAGFTTPWCSLVYDMTLACGESRIPTPPISC